jgi:hypothetical protein
MMPDHALFQAKTLDQVADAVIPVAQRLKDRQTRRISQGRERLGHQLCPAFRCRHQRLLTAHQQSLFY